MVYVKTITWVTLVLMFVLHVAIPAKLRCYKGSLENYREVEIDSPDALLNSTDPYIDSLKGTKIFIFGLNGSPNTFPVPTLIPKLLSLKKYNVCLLNWKKAQGGILGPFLGYFPVVLPSTKKVGEKFGKTIVKLIALGVNKAFHLIGHSVGAHLAGYAGRVTQTEGITLPRITALDGAGPGFIDSEYKPVDTTCAAFVDWVHCDPGFFGLNKSMGHVDFWPSYGAFTGGDALLPGCSPQTSFVDFISHGNLCNHNRCLQLYNASLSYPMILEGSKAANYSTWVNNGGDSSDINYIGPAVIKTKRGNYYLNITSEYPYGKGKEGR